MSEKNIISVSGGKDSTALLLLAIERGTENMEAVFADTGNEHPQTYEYVQYLNDKVFPIRTIRADFASDMARKRSFIATHWRASLMKDTPEVPGQWLYIGRAPMEAMDGEDAPGWVPPDAPAIPSDPYQPQKGEFWQWLPTIPVIPGMTNQQAEAKIARALAILQPTGNPFLDLCLLKGRFPSAKAAFCSEELKRNPIVRQVQMPLLQAGDDIISWQGVRADESPKRALLTELELKLKVENQAELWNYRPILKWTVEQVFAMHAKHGIEPNPLYKQGMGRVGCMPCINCRKDELLEISKRFPEVIDRIAEWELIVAEASKRNAATFFASSDLGEKRAEKAYEAGNIRQFVKWSQTSRGNKNFDMFRMQDDGPLCTSIYGLCE